MQGLRSLLALSLAVALAGATLPETASGKSGGSGGERAGRGQTGKSHAGKGHGGKGHAGKRHPGHHARSRTTTYSVIGAGAAWPWWYYDPYFPFTGYYPPPPIQYVERAAEDEQAAPAWLYCASARGYFPYVADCPEGWGRVPTTPPASTMEEPGRNAGDSRSEAPVSRTPEVQP